MKDFKAGTDISQNYHKSFQPGLLNRDWEILDMEILNLLSKADRQLGRLDMYSEHVPDIDLFISLHMAKEATQSSKIEGTRTNMEEAFLDKEDVTLEKRDDWEEVQNYIAAMNTAIEMLEDIPFSSRLIRESHKILLQGVRGEQKLPGEFRTSQNWIGGASINDAVFIPPIQSSVPELMGDLEKFAHNPDILLPDLLNPTCKFGLVYWPFQKFNIFINP